MPTDSGKTLSLPTWAADIIADSTGHIGRLRRARNLEHYAATLLGEMARVQLRQDIDSPCNRTQRGALWDAIVDLYPHLRPALHLGLAFDPEGE